MDLSEHRGMQLDPHNTPAFNLFYMHRRMVKQEKEKQGVPQATGARNASSAVMRRRNS